VKTRTNKKKLQEGDIFFLYVFRALLLFLAFKHTAKLQAKSWTIVFVLSA
jgi:hypothetical protein